MVHINVDNFFFGELIMTVCQGGIVNNFLLKKVLKNLFLSKCQSLFAMGIIALPHFPPLYPYTLPHFLPPLSFVVIV